MLSDFVQNEIRSPSSRKKTDESRTLYQSRQFRRPAAKKGYGLPVLCDFGEARIGQSHKGLIQPELYRAPEVLFNMEWGCSVDIWNVAVLVSLLSSGSIFSAQLLLTYSLQIWDLFEGKHLFHALDEAQESSASHHVAEMVGYLGTPALEYLHRSEVTKNVFNEQGQCSFEACLN